MVLGHGFIELAFTHQRAPQIGMSEPGIGVFGDGIAPERFIVLIGARLPPGERRQSEQQ